MKGGGGVNNFHSRQPQMDGPERGKIEGGVRGARMFHLVSLSLQISPADFAWPVPWRVCGCCLLGGFVVGFFLPGKFDFNLMLFPVVDRPCLALVRQCRKKRGKSRGEGKCIGQMMR